MKSNDPLMGLAKPAPKATKKKPAKAKAGQPAQPVAMPTSGRGY